MTYDLIIVGGGPGGVAAGVYAARKKLRTALVTDSFGGQSLVSARVENWIGTPSLSGFELAQALEAHLRAQEGIEIIHGDRVAKVTRTGDKAGAPFLLVTESGKTFEAHAVLLTSGSRRRRLGVPGEQELEGKGVAYCATCDAPLFEGKDVAVVGGGNAGLEATQDLLPYARTITLVHDGEVLKGDARTVEQVRREEKVQFVLDAEATGVRGARWVEGLEYLEKGTGAVKVLPVQGVFVEAGVVPNSEPVRDLVNVNERGEVVVDPMTQATSVPGIWAAGDVTDGLYRQNNISAGDAIKAVLNICNFLKLKG